MHEYLRAVGFSDIKGKAELKHLLQMTEESYQSERTSGNRNGKDFSERKKEFAPGMGIMLRGEYDEEENYQRDYYFPYFQGKQEKLYDTVTVERHAEKESYAGICDDISRNGIHIAARNPRAQGRQRRELCFLHNIINHFQLGRNPSDSDSSGEICALPFVDHAEIHGNKISVLHFAV